MAFTLEQLRNKVQTSIFGRRLGLDNADHIVGPRGIRLDVTEATSATTGTAITNSGLTILSMSTGAAKGYTLAAPQPGVYKELVATSSSTKGMVITLTGAVLNSTGGSTANTITFNGRGDRALLRGVSTAAWVALALNGAST